MMDWYLTLSRHGWIAPNWPREYGGMGLDTGKMLILLEESERYGVSRVPDQGIVQVGPILMRTARRRSSNITCRKSCRANTSGARAIRSPMRARISRAFRLQPCSTATSSSSTARKSGRRSRTTRRTSTCWCAPSKEGKKQDGISFLLVDVKSPGITIRPIRNIAGHEEFCEVFFDNVRVPQANLVGEPQRGLDGRQGAAVLRAAQHRQPAPAALCVEAARAARTREGIVRRPGFVDKFTRSSST